MRVCVHGYAFLSTRPQLMEIPSRARSPVAPVRFNRSDPARSTKWNLAVSVSYLDSPFIYGRRGGGGGEESHIGIVWQRALRVTGGYAYWIPTEHVGASPQVTSGVVLSVINNVLPEWQLDLLIKTAQAMF